VVKEFTTRFLLLFRSKRKNEKLLKKILDLTAANMINLHCFKKQGCSRLNGLQ